MKQEIEKLVWTSFINRFNEPMAHFLNSLVKAVCTEVDSVKICCSDLKQMEKYLIKLFTSGTIISTLVITY